MDTAECCQFFDNLFDSLNGSSFNCYKNWRKAVTTKTGHLEFWGECIEVLRTMHFKNAAGKQLRTPSLANFITTLKNFKILFEILTQNGFTYIMPRTFNQDPVENFFGKIRQRAYRYTNPTISSFSALYKSLLVNNLTSKHSLQGNCEDDSSAIFFTLKNFINKIPSNDEPIIVEPVPNIFFPTPQQHPLLKQVITYIAGYIVRKTSCKTCEECGRNLLAQDTSSNDYQFTLLKEFDNNKRLLYVQPQILENIRKCYFIIMYILENYITEKALKRRIILTLDGKVNFEKICEVHGNNVKSKIITTLATTLIYNYIKQINNVMVGKDLRQISPNHPKAFIYARQMYLKYKKK